MANIACISKMPTKFSPAQNTANNPGDKNATSPIVDGINSAFNVGNSIFAR